MTISSTTLHYVRLNFIYRFEAISPAYTKISRGFHNVDRIKLGIDPGDPSTFGNHSGAARDFTVRRLAGDRAEDLEHTNLASRASRHIYEVTVAYPTAIGLENDIHEIMDSDRNDLIESVRDGSVSKVGIPGDASAVIPAYSNRYLEDRLDDSGDVWLQVYRWVRVALEQ